MAEIRKLNGKRIAVLATDGVELIELDAPVAALRVSGADVEVISLHDDKIRSMNLHEPGRKIKVDRTVDDADPASYDGLLIPGGFISPDLLRQSAAARNFVRAFELARKPIASLCHGPWLLASAGLLEGRRLTSWPGLRDDLVHGGAIWLNQPVVRDGNWVTSRGPQDLGPFIEALREHFAKTRLLRTEEADLPAESAPQSDRPPELVLGTMRWMPKPSIRTALGATALAAGAVFALRSRAFR